MRTFSKAAAATIAALFISQATVGAASAFDGRGPGAGPGRFHGPGPGPRPGWHGPHGHGGWGPAVGLGVVGGLAAGAIAGSMVARQSCYRVVPTYDPYGNYVGDQTVDVCD